MVRRERKTGEERIWVRRKGYGKPREGIREGMGRGGMRGFMKSRGRGMVKVRGDMIKFMPIRANGDRATWIRQIFKLSEVLAH